MKTESAVLPRGRQGGERIGDEVKQAAIARRFILIEYNRPEWDATRTYEVAPYSYRNDGKTLFAYDALAKSIKAFATDSIIRVQQTDKTFRPKWPVEIGAEAVQS